MILGLLSDAHGNPDALRGCLDALAERGAERCWFLGDAVGYLPDEDGVLALLRDRDVTCLRGNHEAMLLGELPIPPERAPAYRLEEVRARITREQLSWIREWPQRLELAVDGSRILLLHGSPADPLQGYLYPDSDLAPLAEQPFDLIAMGHTHRPFLARAGGVTVLNVGSAGLPRDVGHLASCACYDTLRRSAEILRVPFDAGALAERWAGRIHPSAAAVLRRPAAAPPVGTLVA